MQKNCKPQIRVKVDEKELKNSFPLVQLAFDEIKDILIFDSVHDVDDYLQEGYLALTQAFQNHDPERSKWMTYAMRSIKNAMIDFSRNGCAQKRCPKGEIVSLEFIVDNQHELDFGLLKNDLNEMSYRIEDLVYEFIDKKAHCKTHKIAAESFILQARYPGLTNVQIAKNLGIAYGSLRRARSEISYELRRFLEDYI